MVRVGPVPQNLWATTKRQFFGRAVPVLWGTMEEISRFGEAVGRITDDEGE